MHLRTIVKRATRTKQNQTKSKTTIKKKLDKKYLKFSSCSLKNFPKLDVDDLGYIVLEEIEQWFVDMLSGQGYLYGWLGGVHLLQNNIEVDGLVASVSLSMDFAVQVLIGE